MKIKILEIGCGQGFLTSCLSKNRQNDVLGIDISKEDIATAKKRYPKVNFQVMDSQKLLFQNDSFDLVYTMDVLEHVDSLTIVLKEIYRVLKRGGKLCVNIPHLKSEKWLGGLRSTYAKEIHHVRIFKKDELLNMLKSDYILIKEKHTGFLTHLELLYFFKRKRSSKTQLGIGNWRDSVFGMSLHLSMLYFYPIVFQTPLKYFPLWIITIPIGFMIELFGNKLMPKSIYYEFRKI